MQHKHLGRDNLRLYHDHLQSDHDYRIWVEVLTMEEKRVGQMDVLDGQVNVSWGGDGPDRTASVVLSDPEHALTFGNVYTEDDDGALWVNRLVRVMHEVTVPTLGEIETVVMVGVPTSVGRQGGEVTLELADKSVLCDHGVRPRSYRKGANVTAVLRHLLRELCGEHHLRIPSTRKRLSRPYAVGMGDDSMTPLQLARLIAAREKGWRLYWSADGFATAEPTRAEKRPVVVHDLLALPDSSTSFTDFFNYVKVNSKREVKIRVKDGPDKDKKRDVQEVTHWFNSVAVLKRKHRLSEGNLARNGAPRTLPFVLTDDDLKSQRQVNRRAREILGATATLRSEQTYEIIPLFHLDIGDKVRLPMHVGLVPIDECSIPLGTGGNMTLGKVKWVSRPVKSVRVRGHHRSVNWTVRQRRRRRARRQRRERRERRE